jgi:hypothetical protein
MPSVGFKTTPTCTLSNESFSLFLTKMALLEHNYLGLLILIHRYVVKVSRHDWFGALGIKPLTMVVVLAFETMLCPRRRRR